MTQLALLLIKFETQKFMIKSTDRGQLMVLQTLKDLESYFIVSLEIFKMAII